ncbi:MAG: hypothetical protein ACW972_06965 [Promethearchaeota archaeon]|jgi:hypothetical protein
MSLSIGPCSSSEGGTAYTQKNCIINSATGTKEEIISMTTKPDGSTLYYTKSTSAAGPGAAWAQRGYTRNSSGELYAFSGSGGMPQQINNPKPYWGTPVTSADPQDFQYLTDSRPGAASFKSYWANIFPWWENVFGVRQSSPPQGFSAEQLTKETGLKVGATLGLLYLYAKTRRK